MIGILLVQLGTPSEPTPRAVRKYLREFLSDQRVIDAPKWFWLPILNLIILSIRPRKVAKLYQSIWTEKGSPLRVIAHEQTDRLQEKLDIHHKNKFLVQTAMTYGKDNIRLALDKFKQQNINKIIIIPQYPQYSATTTGAVFDKVSEYYKAQKNIPNLVFINKFYNRNLYLHALSQSIKNHWDKHGRGGKLLFSFHGIPKKYYDNGDSYPDECKLTAKKVVEKLGLDDAHWDLAFQSRFGPTEWVKPYTSDVLEEWGQQGLSRVDVICPAFTADCLETLEEIQCENKAIFQTAGGGDFYYIPALNSSPDYINVLMELVLENSQEWIYHGSTKQPITERRSPCSVTEKSG